MDGWSDRGRGRPSPAPRSGAERGPLRPRAATGRGDRPSSSGEAGPCFPAAAARALPQVEARGPREAGRNKRSWRLPQGSRFAEEPGPRTRSAAGPAGSRGQMRPRLRLGPERFATLRQVWRSRSAPRAPRPPQPSCFLPNK